MKLLLCMSVRFICISTRGCYLILFGLRKDLGSLFMELCVQKRGCWKSRTRLDALLLLPHHGSFWSSLYSFLWQTAMLLCDLGAGSKRGFCAVMDQNSQNASQSLKAKESVFHIFIKLFSLEKVFFKNIGNASWGVPYMVEEYNISLDGWTVNYWFILCVHNTQVPIFIFLSVHLKYVQRINLLMVAFPGFSEQVTWILALIIPERKNLAKINDLCGAVSCHRCGHFG